MSCSQPYFPNGRDPTSEHFLIKLGWIDALGELILAPAGAASRNLGLRIDHIWVSPALAERVVAAEIDVAERRKASASDHAPVIVELDADGL